LQTFSFCGSSGYGAATQSAALSNFRIDPALAAFSTLFDTDETGACFSEGERANVRALLEPIHSGIDRRNRNWRAAAAIHLLVEMAENHARGRQNAGSGAHDFRNRNVNVAIGNYGARANDQLRLQSYGVQGPGIGYPVG
jgi:hypothetical protein